MMEVSNLSKTYRSRGKTVGTLYKLREREAAARAYKYDEDRLLAEVRAYVDSTYGGHYVADDNVQAMDLIIASGLGQGKCLGDVIKYASRYGKKEGKNRKDLLKIIHYALFMLYIHDRENKE